MIMVNINHETPCVCLGTRKRLVRGITMTHGVNKLSNPCRETAHLLTIVVNSRQTLADLSTQNDDIMDKDDHLFQPTMEPARFCPRMIEMIIPFKDSELRASSGYSPSVQQSDLFWSIRTQGPWPRVECGIDKQTHMFVVFLVV